MDSKEPNEGESTDVSINSIFDLADRYCVTIPPLGEDISAAQCRRRTNQVVASIGRKVYKYTENGICFACHDPWEVVTLSGHCEGVDCGFPPAKLKFPFTESAWDFAISKAEHDSSMIWKLTHGCEGCYNDAYYEDMETYQEVGGPVDPDCTECDGNGTVI